MFHLQVTMVTWRHDSLLLLGHVLTLVTCAATLHIHGVELATNLKDIVENGLGQSKIQVGLSHT